MSEKMNICIMIAANGDPKVQPRFERDTPQWLEYNASYRFGQALFINGEYQTPEDGHVHHFAETVQPLIDEMTAEAKERLERNPIPADWHLNEGRYYPPGKSFRSTGSYALDSIRDHKSGPFKF